MHDHSQTEGTKSAQYTALRRWTRYAVSVSLRVRVPTPSGEEYMLAHGRDVSQGGMAVYVPVELEIGQTVLLELMFPFHQQRLSLFATVKNRTGFKYGVEFLQPTPEQQEIILSNLHKLLVSTGLD